MRIKIKEWDSEFFGFSIGVLDISSGISLKSETNRDRTCSCVYVCSEDCDALNTFKLRGYTSTGVYELITFSKTLSDDVIFSDVDAYTSHEYGKLKRLGRLAGHTSRFKHDLRFLPHLDRLYDTWVQNSVEGSLADEVFISSCDTEVTGLITLKVDCDCGQIGLLAVDELSQGKGLATNLLKSVESYCYRKKIFRINVATQGDNIGATKCYLKNGYTVSERKYVSHYWRVDK